MRGRISKRAKLLPLRMEGDRGEDAFKNPRISALLSSVRDPADEQLLDDSAVRTGDGSRWVAHLAAGEPGGDRQYSCQGRPAKQPVSEGGGRKLRIESRNTTAAGESRQCGCAEHGGRSAARTGRAHGLRFHDGIDARRGSHGRRGAEWDAGWPQGTTGAAEFVAGGSCG